MTSKGNCRTKQKRRHEISSLPKSKHSQIAFYLLSPSRGIFCSLIPKALRQWLSEERKKKLLISFTPTSRRRLMKDWSRHPDTLVILLLEKQNQEQCFFLPVTGTSQIFSFDLHASGHLSSLRPGPGQLAAGVWDFAENPLLLAQWEKLTPKDSVSLAFCELTLNLLCLGSENLSECCHFY